MTAPDPGPPGPSDEPEQEREREIDDLFQRGEVSYGPFKWQPGTNMTWAQYRANTRIYGYFKFQRSLADDEELYPQILPPREVLEHDDRLQKLLVTAWMKHEDDKPPLRNMGRASPPSEYELSGTSAPTYASSMREKGQWFPWVTYWPDSDNPQYIVRSNRANHPPLPPPVDTPVKYRHDAKKGTQEWSWIPGWAHHREHKTYMPFIPLKEPKIPREHRIMSEDGGWYFATHLTIDDDLCWYRVNFEHLVTGGGEGLYQLDSKLKANVVRTANDLYMAWIKEMTMIPKEMREQWYIGSPTHKFAEMKAAMAFLLCEAGPSWEVRGALSAYQQITLEVRGWLAYSAALRTARVTTLTSPWKDSKAGLSEMQKLFPPRRSRGVFVLDDEYLAMQYAAFDVPVWHVVPYSAANMPNPLDFKRGNACAYYGAPHFTAQLEMKLRGDPKMKAPDGYLTMARRRAEEKENDEKKKQEKEFRAAVAAKAGASSPHAQLPSASWGPRPREAQARPAKKASTSTYRTSSSTQPSVSAHRARSPSPQADPDNYDDDFNPGDGGASPPEDEVAPPPLPEHADRAVEVARAELQEHRQSLSGPADTPADEPALGAETWNAGKEAQTGTSAQKRKEPPFPTSEEPHRRKRLSVHKQAVAAMDQPALYKNIPVRLTSYHEPKRELPDWWPRQFTFQEKVSKTVDTTRAREIKLAACKFAVPQVAKGQQAVRKMPSLAYFMNAWSEKSDANRTKEENVIRALFRWLQIRGYYLATVVVQEIGEDDGFTNTQWRKIKKCMLMDHESYPIVKRLGLDVIRQEEPPAVTEEELEAMMSTERPQMTLRQVLDGIKDQLSFDGHKLTPPENESDQSWLSLEWERYVLWDISELEFRYEMLSLAVKMRSWYPEKADLQQLPDLEYFNLVKECWSEGLDALKPRGENWLCSNDPARRIPALRSFVEVMRYWPRADEMLGPWEKHWAETSVPPDLDSDEYEELERSAWYCYLQSYYDHRGRAAPLPYVRPPPPFKEDSQL